MKIVDMGDLSATDYDLESDVAYELLITLLEYQLSSPVQWIATQATLHESRQHGQRYIEIGPADTLRSMLKKTLAQHPDHGHDDASECLTFGEKLDEIKRAAEDESDAVPADSEDVPEVPKTAEPDPVALPSPPVITSPPPQPRKTLIVADAPPSAAEVVLAITAFRLRVPRGSIDTNRSIKLLAKGRSALQNEIVGNLAAEFGQLPDAVEDMPLAELSQDLQRTFGGKFGRFLNEWLAKAVQAKLAPSLTVSKIRSYLSKTFGLQEGRQNSFFLTAGFDEIPSRLGNDQESWQAVSRWAEAYAKDHGLEQAAGPTDPQSGTFGTSGAPSPEDTIAGTKLAEFGRDLANLMARHFNSDESSSQQSQRPGSPQQQTGEPADQDTRHLGNELGHDFINGTRPIFKPEMVYRYLSGWNWAVQDLYVTLSNLVTRAQTEDARESHLLHDWIDSAHKRLQARATDRMYRCVEYLVGKWEQSPASLAREYCLLLLRRLLQKSTHDATKAHPSLPDMPTRFTAPRTIITEAGDITYEEVSVTDAHTRSREDRASPARPELESTASAAAPVPSLPQTQLLTRASPSSLWETNTELTAQLREAERRFVTEGDSGACGTALVIGAGPRSIGILVVRRLLEAGCRVALCTSRLTLASRKVIAKLFAEVARPGAELVLLPFNQASVQDIDGIVNYINNTLGWEIDHLIPFAAIPEPRRTIQEIDSLSELAHRAMLTNTLRLMGSIATSKERRHILNHSTQVLVPLSPNHGQFGSDGLYSESKLALETLLNRWTSEPWSDQLSICAVRIGWTRGTSIMADNDILAEEIEKLGVRTFSALEMATLLTLVMSPALAEACTLQPVLCDFGGGFQTMPDVRGIRASIQNTASVRRKLNKEAELDNVPRGGHTAAATDASEKRAGLRNPFPPLPEQREIASGGKSEAPLDLDSTVVIAGFAELGAAGSSRTRWELEAYGEFSLEGCVELAWMTGLIRYVCHRVHEGKELGPGWVECETGAPIREMDVKSKLEGRIREHTGIRILDPDERHNADPRLRNMLHEVGTQEDLGPFECSPQAAEALKARHGDAVEVLSNDGVTATARVRRGVSVFIPKAMNTDFFVGAQIPTGWDAARYGIPPELLTQVDRSTLLVLVCVVEAFLSAGVADVYELYRYLHVSEVGNCVGSSAGGGTAAQLFMQQRLLGKETRSDLLAESFVGSASAWVNMLLLSASGPIKTAAGTCATSIESLDTACELIASGRSRLCLVGGHDGFVSSIFYEFGEMGALGNAANDARGGREPHEMSRPFTSTRGGFAFGEGVGVQVVCTAALALEMGLPIYGVVAMTHMAGDKLGRSVPAPGRGLLTAAKQSGAVPVPSVLLDPSLRARRIRSSLAHAERRAEEDEAAVRAEAQREGRGAAETEARVQGTREAARLEKKAILRTLAHSYWIGHPGISPIVGALSVFGLGVDDITFASLHGTGTRLNDVNECATLDRQMRHLGRAAGNPLFTVAQKSVVGHGLSAAGAWAINGALQAMHAGLVPGNRNADDVDAELEPFDRLLLASENIAVRPDDMRAFSVTSFGIGQKGAQVLIVHPRYVYAALSDDQYRAYRARQVARARVAPRALDRVFHGQPLVQAKDETPYVGDEHDFLLDPLARAS